MIGTFLGLFFRGLFVFLLFFSNVRNSFIRFMTFARLPFKEQLKLKKRLSVCLVTIRFLLIVGVGHMNLSSNLGGALFGWLIQG